METTGVHGANTHSFLYLAIWVFIIVCLVVALGGAAWEARHRWRWSSGKRALRELARLHDRRR